jgi:hypothetical protein
MRSLAWLALVGLCACGSEVPAYAPCEGSSECEAPSDACYDVTVEREDGTTARAAFCSRACERHEDCPGEAACLALEVRPDSPICWERCETSADCTSPLACTAVPGAMDVSRVCMP